MDQLFVLPRLSDSPGVSVLVTTLFTSLDGLYVMVRKSQRIHGLFEGMQRKENQKVLFLKILYTVRWNSREFCLNPFLLVMNAF